MKRVERGGGEIKRERGGERGRERNRERESEQGTDSRTYRQK